MRALTRLYVTLRTARCNWVLKERSYRAAWNLNPVYQVRLSPLCRREDLDNRGCTRSKENVIFLKWPFCKIIYEGYSDYQINTCSWIWLMFSWFGEDIKQNDEESYFDLQRRVAFLIDTNFRNFRYKRRGKLK